MTMDYILFWNVSIMDQLKPLIFQCEYKMLLTVRNLGLIESTYRRAHLSNVGNRRPVARWPKNLAVHSD